MVAHGLPTVLSERCLFKKCDVHRTIVKPTKNNDFCCSWPLLGCPWPPLGCSWGALGPLLAALGALLGHSWPLLGRSWPLLAGLGSLLKKCAFFPARVHVYVHLSWAPRWEGGRSGVDGGRRCSRAACPPWILSAKVSSFKGLENTTYIRDVQCDPQHAVPCCAGGGGLKSASRDHRRHPLGFDRCERLSIFASDCVE